MLAQTPPMGWNSWNTFGEDISEDLIKEIADTLIATGLAKAGYNYLVIDDCWAEKSRSKDGLLIPDHNKFPNGMKAVSDYVHSKGLKFGMYSCVGTMTCAAYPGSLEHEFVDAQTFASWGVDYLKYDYCYKPHYLDGHLLYKRMGMALRNCGREILFSACNWGADDVYSWIRSTGAHMYRSSGDIEDRWESIRDIAVSQMDKDPYNAPFCYNDMDMLVVGMYGKGNVGCGGCTDEEYKTHFSLWCMMNSPLMIGCDVRSMNKETLKILTNEEIIALNQDSEGRQAYLVNRNAIYNDVRILVKPMSDGSFGIGFFNMGDNEARGSLQFWDIGLQSITGYGFKMRDLWEHEDVGVYKENYTCSLKPHQCKVFRANLIK